MASGETVSILIGLGNPVCGDDAVGLHVASRVEALLRERPSPGVRATTSTRGGFELLDLLEGAHSAVLVDAFLVPGGHAGRVRRLGLQEVSGSARLAGAHDVKIGDVLELGRLAGLRMPDRVEIVGVEVEGVDRLGESLSPAVAAAVEPLAHALYERLVGMCGLKTPPPRRT